VVRLLCKVAGGCWRRHFLSAATFKIARGLPLWPNQAAGLHDIESSAEIGRALGSARVFRIRR
jgi:hypothetical protein